MKTIEADEIRLRSLKIPHGWFVSYNQLYDIEPDWNTKVINSQGSDIYETFFDEDMFQAVNIHSGILIDIGWRPVCDPHGKYLVTIVKPSNPDFAFEELRSLSWDFDWRKPLKVFETKNNEELVRFMEDAMLQITRGKMLGDA